MKRYKTVDDYIAHVGYWQDEPVCVREILNSTALEETPLFTTGAASIC